MVLTRGKTPRFHRKLPLMTHHSLPTTLDEPLLREFEVSLIKMVAKSTHTTTTRQQNQRKRRGVQSRRIIGNDNGSNSGSTIQLSTFICTL